MQPFEKSACRTKSRNQPGAQNMLHEVVWRARADRNAKEPCEGLWNEDARALEPGASADDEPDESSAETTFLMNTRFHTWKPGMIRRLKRERCGTWYVLLGA